MVKTPTVGMPEGNLSSFFSCHLTKCFFFCYILLSLKITVLRLLDELGGEC